VKQKSAEFPFFRFIKQDEKASSREKIPSANFSRTKVNIKSHEAFPAGETKFYADAHQ
jgi:hypothetical protein